MKYCAAYLRMECYYSNHSKAHLVEILCSSLLVKMGPSLILMPPYNCSVLVARSMKSIMWGFQMFWCVSDSTGSFQAYNVIAVKTQSLQCHLHRNLRQIENSSLLFLEFQKLPLPRHLIPYVTMMANFHVANILTATDSANYSRRGLRRIADSGYEVSIFFISEPICLLCLVHTSSSLSRTFRGFAARSINSNILSETRELLKI